MPVHEGAPTPRTTSWRMPAEWEEHERCLVAWPTRRELWGPPFAQAKAEYAATVEAIAAFEPVTLVVSPGAADEARRAVTSGVEIVEIPIDDSWVRDSGPIVVVDTDGRRAGVDFRFNSWGERFLPSDRDAASAAATLRHLGIERIASEHVANGGVIVPLAAHPLDDDALAVVRTAFPDREVVGVPGRILSYGGGGPHCITQQVPRRG